MQFSKDLSPRAQRVVSGYFTTMGDNFEGYLKLLVSLYAQRSQAKRDVLSPLKDYVDDFSETLSAEELTILLGEYKTVMAYCFSVFGGNPITPESEFGETTSDYRIELCKKITAPKPGSDILLSHVGLWALSFLCKDYTFKGYESSTLVWAITQIFIDVFDIQADIKNSSFDELPTSFMKQYDYIYYTFITHNPFSSFNSWDCKRSVAELISLSKNILKDNGQMCCILPNNFTYNDAWEKFREMLTDYQYKFEIEVIEFVAPQKIFEGFRDDIWSECVLSIKKTHVAKITLVEAGKDGLEKDINTTFSSSRAEAILTAIKEDDKRFIWHGTPSDLFQNHNLNPTRYLMEQNMPVPEVNEKLIKIGELVEVIPCPLCKSNAGGWKGLTIKTRDLATNLINCNIDMDRIQTLSNWQDIHLLSDDALLFCFSMGDARISKFTYEGEKIGLVPGIIPFKIKSVEVVTEDFLLKSLMMKETLNQARFYARNNDSGMLSVSDFMRLKIIVPSVKKQLECCLYQSQESLSVAYKKLQEEQENFRRDVHMKKHTIIETIYYLNLWWRQLQKARKEGKEINKDDTVVGNELYHVPISKVFDNLQSGIEQLEHQISSFDLGYGKVPEKIGLYEFILGYTEQHQNPIFRYQLGFIRQNYYRFRRIKPSENIYMLGGEVFIKFPREALTTIFDNIINNALAHGFDGNEEDDNKIKIRINHVESGKVAVTIANNGAPLHPQLSERDVFTYGKTTKGGNNHSGIGGYQVYSLMQEFGGIVKLLPQDGEYTVIYELTFDVLEH